MILLNHFAIFKCQILYIKQKLNTNISLKYKFRIPEIIKFMKLYIINIKIRLIQNILKKLKIKLGDKNAIIV